MGKSALFNALTSTYVTVSNYPGTTVEVYRGTAQIDGCHYEVIDTPGMYSLLPITEEERVGRSLLLAQRPDIILHVIDAKNIDRMLPFTLQLIEAGLPVILVINMIDESAGLGISIDREKLEARLNVPVISVAAIRNQGIPILKKRLRETLRLASCLVLWGDY